MTDGTTIAIVEDDDDIRTQLAGYLENEGFRVVTFDGGAGLDRRLAAGPAPDLIVLDWMLPGEDGLSICRRLREGGGPPVVMLTAKDEDIDRVLGLEMGADDYVSKPFNPRVLLARIRAVLRRAAGGSAAAAGPASERLSVADLVVDLAARRVTIGEPAVEIPLTSAEYDLLHCFVTRPQRVLSRDQLLDWTRGRTADIFDRTIDVQVSRLRHKLDAAGSQAAGQIKTVRNAGYILAAPVTAVAP
ncbi:DNA-binding response regulator, OmpR family, contains REC and winged-helix (wHTH) domain [Methylobacterium sp. 174MFSha1.1]|uniref:response regulator n=1 Tax=Methylobacterium sp. 174MFSha1.1 TaxID=1502749 RepID=UPI0008E66906|nr:response regulator transcription factor [Methylobacterium sp. 174MFSha1.1]SFV05834.1 DNA-binding response regulator, OmpR family, contains REC and winged-helix (wHTH) domain [Methylobacterium sp. 174MFSha1.1]